MDTDDTLYADCIKLFQLPLEISEQHGPLQFIDKKSTKVNWKRLFFRGQNFRLSETIKKYTCDNHSLLVDTRSCLHRAGVPDTGNARLMLMVQIRDKLCTEDLDELYELQTGIEPTHLK